MPIPTVPADPVRVHVQDLIDAGMTQAAINRKARTGGTIMNELLHGRYLPGRPPVCNIAADTAARLLAVQFDPAATRPKPTGGKTCTPGTRFTLIGCRVGRCDECGQLASVRDSSKGQIMFAHPRPEPGAEVLHLLALAPQRHPDCGTPRGHQRHVREKTTPCDLCKAAKNGYNLGRNSALSAVHRAQQAAVPRELVEAAIEGMRAVWFRRPYPQLREVARKVLRAADAAKDALAELDKVAA